MFEMVYIRPTTLCFNKLLQKPGLMSTVGSFCFNTAFEGKGDLHIGLWRIKLAHLPRLCIFGYTEFDDFEVIHDLFSCARWPFLRDEIPVTLFSL